MLYYGFPVVLLTTSDIDGVTNISPISSNWCLGNKIVIGVGTDGKAYENIKIVPEVVLNIASNDLMPKVEKIAKLTGKQPIPAEKVEMGYSFSGDKFIVGGFTRQKSISVKPDRIEECKLQIEAFIENITHRDWLAIVELEIKSVHADQSILKQNNYIDPLIWNPLIYNFRSYHGLSEQIGKNFRFEN
jgi:flavin reductase (DIM6/NTAB) family NADH-FMN oxidoreductase RutF